MFSQPYFYSLFTQTVLTLEVAGTVVVGAMVKKHLYKLYNLYMLS